MHQANIVNQSSKVFTWNGGGWTATSDNSIGSKDTRAIDDQPQVYGEGFYTEFKQSSAIGL
jgi:hypothetical protein